MKVFNFLKNAYYRLFFFFFRMYKPSPYGGKETDTFTVVLTVIQSLSEWLTKFGISIERTRNSEMIINENSINYRWKLANKTGAEVFVSIHLNSGLSEEAFAVYEERGNSLKWQQENSIELGNYIMENMTVMTPANNPVISSTKTRLKTIGVLKYFKGGAGILLEMGGISSEANRNNILNNHGIIGREIATGVYQYFNNGAKPPTAIYKCVYY
ncbi:MAG: N-acetylmuramoyl-L-alanine amidase [Bacteroidales bacterium]|nr:N-acetylmuramoyl-L-alanine amidase [Bacteroidales bacterium]